MCEWLLRRDPFLWDLSPSRTGASETELEDSSLVSIAAESTAEDLGMYEERLLNTTHFGSHR